MTIEQIFTVAGFVLAAGIAVFVAVVIGHQIARFIRAIGRVTEVVTTIVGRLLRLALIGGLVIGLIAGGVWWAIQPTASAAPITPRPTRAVGDRETRTPVVRNGLTTMSVLEARRYGEGFRFINTDNTVCEMHKVEYQEELVGYCE